jgi:hypothetical protein
MQRFDSQSFQAWRDNPLTQVFLQFLKDQQQALAQQWAAGSPFQLAPISAEQVKALLMGELSDLKWADYAGFYGLDEASED